MIYRLQNPRYKQARFLAVWKDPQTDLLKKLELTTAEMKHERYQRAVHCRVCASVVFSQGKNISNWCSCGNVCVEGGKTFFKWWGDDSHAKVVLLDLIDEIILGEDLAIPPVDQIEF